MVKGKVPALHFDRETQGALQLDALAAILPMDRRGRLAELLTDDRVETFEYLAREGVGENSLRVLDVGSRLFGGLGGRRCRAAAARPGRSRRGP